MTYRQPKLPFVSCVTGRFESADKVGGPAYWTRLVRRTVRFHDAVHALDDRDYGIFVEMGPQPNLLFMARQCVDRKGQRWLPALRQRGSDWTHVLKTLQELYLCGVPIDWKGFDRDYYRKKLALPTYPFQRKTYRRRLSFQTGDAQRDAGVGDEVARHPLLGKRVHVAGTERGHLRESL